MSFSKKFISGLETKSKGFQNEFWGIMECFYDFFEYDEEKMKEFDDYIESKFSYYDKGNVLYESGFFVGGEIDSARKEEYFFKIIEHFRELFLYDEDTGINIATNIIVAINLPKSLSEDITALIEMIIQTLKPDSPPELKIYVKHDSDECFACNIAIMK